MRQQTQGLLSFSSATSGQKFRERRFRDSAGNGNVPRDDNVHVFLGAASEDGLGLGHGEAAEATAVDVYDLVADEKATIPGKKERTEKTSIIYVKKIKHFSAVHQMPKKSLLYCVC